MRLTFFGLITAVGLAVAACGDDGTNTNTAAIVGDAPVPPGTEVATPPPPPPPPAATGKENTDLPPSVPRPDPPCTSCPQVGNIIITPSR